MGGGRQFGLFEARWSGKGRWCDFGYGLEASLSWAWISARDTGVEQ